MKIPKPNINLPNPHLGEKMSLVGDWAGRQKDAAKASLGRKAAAASASIDRKKAALTAKKAAFDAKLHAAGATIDSKLTAASDYLRSDEFAQRVANGKRRTQKYGYGVMSLASVGAVPAVRFAAREVVGAQARDSTRAGGNLNHKLSYAARLDEQAARLALAGDHRSSKAIAKMAEQWRGDSEIGTAKYIAMGAVALIGGNLGEYKAHVDRTDQLVETARDAAEQVYAALPVARRP